MRIRIADGQKIAGPLGVAEAGDVVDWPDDIANPLIAAGCAVPVDPPPEIEEATQPPVETAVKRGRSRRK